MNIYIFTSFVILYSMLNFVEYLKEIGPLLWDYIKMLSDMFWGN